MTIRGEGGTSTATKARRVSPAASAASAAARSRRLRPGAERHGGRPGQPRSRPVAGSRPGERTPHLLGIEGSLVRPRRRARRRRRGMEGDMTAGPDSPLAGGCLCGAVRYELTAEPHDLYHCHCSICRKCQGALYPTYASVARSGFRLLQGADALSTYASSASLRRRFCQDLRRPRLWRDGRRPRYGRLLGRHARRRRRPRRAARRRAPHLLGVARRLVRTGRRPPPARRVLSARATADRPIGGGARRGGSP